MELENHPIPQDVTGFQFKLIGEMTVKQFAILAGSLILAYIFFILPIFAFIKIPMSIFMFFSGTFIAFIPVNGRPANVMLSHFIRSLFSAEQFIFQKKGGDLQVLSTFIPDKTTLNKPLEKTTGKSKLDRYIATIHTASKNKLDEKEELFLNSFSNFANNSNLQSVAQQIPSQNTAFIPPLEKKIPKTQNEAYDRDANLQDTTNKILNDGQKNAPRIITQEVLDKKAKEDFEEENSKSKEEAREKEDGKKDGKSQDVQKDALLDEAKKKALELQQQLEEALAQKTKLEEEYLALRKKNEIDKQQAFSPSEGKIQQESANVRKIPKDMTQKSGFATLPDVPNVISGLVKDPRGNLLPNMLVEIKDKDGNPVRAFKTNQLGQFASATTLSNGEYLIEIEDPKGKNKFDLIEITMNGQIILPLEIISTDEREELRKSLFG